MATSKPAHAFTWTKSTKRLQDFAKDLKTALDAVTPSPDTVYKKVSVIALHWVNDDMGVEGLESELLQIFKDKYNYDVESYIIPTATSQVLLSSKLANWSMECSGADTLRIYVYSGHADMAGTTAMSWYIGGTAHPNGGLMGSRINWFGIRTIIESLDGDMCYIFDCCSAGSISMHTGPETMAAVGWDQVATANLNFSFTQALIDTLNDLDGEPETLAGIYARLYRNAHQNQVGACPVHVPKEGSPSVTIARLSKTKAVTRKQPGSLQTPSARRVLLSVQIRDAIDEPDLQQWTNWLGKNLPTGILSTDIKVESLFRGSSVILVTIPAELWTMLPCDDPSFNFVAHVSSNNVLRQAESSIQSSLPHRPIAPSGSENQPLHRQRKSLG